MTIEPALRLLLTRPEADAAPLAQALQQGGHATLIEPMLRIVMLSDAALNLDNVQALLLTSANGARSLNNRSVPRELPVFAVGDATAEEARAQGFTAVTSAGGDVDSLAALVSRCLDPAGGTLCHVAGSDVAGDLAGQLAAHGFKTDRAVLYRTEPTSALSSACQNALRAGEIDGVLFFSPRTAATFVSLAGTAGLASCCQTVVAFCLSQAVACAASATPWRSVRVAPVPRTDALLALLANETES